MKKTTLKSMALLAFFALAISSCTTIDKSMREPNNRVQFTKSDFTFSDQVKGEASTTTILSIDWARLFMKKAGNITSPVPAGGFLPISFASLPIIGGFVSGDRTVNYALYNMMQDNPGYDVILYPTYEVKVVKPILGLGFLIKITDVKATARLGKLNK